MNSSWADFSPGSPTPEGKRARARGEGFAEEPTGFWLIVHGFGHCCTESLTVCRKDPWFLFLRRGRSPTTVNAAELQ
jgi:hypothetical protein